MTEHIHLWTTHKQKMVQATGQSQHPPARLNVAVPQNKRCLATAEPEIQIVQIVNCESVQEVKLMTANA